MNRIKRTLKVVLPLFIAVAVGLTMMGKFATTRIKFGPATLECSVAIGRPGSTLETLAGKAEARTHTAPIHFNVRLVEIDFWSAFSWIRNDLDEQTPTRLRRAVEGAMAEAWLIGLLVSMLSAFAVARLFGLSVRRSLLASLATLAIVLIFSLWARVGFDAEAMKKPQLSGSLQKAPYLYDVLQQRAKNVEALRGWVTDLTEIFMNYYAPSVSVPPINGTRVVKGLLLGDRHLDPVGLKFAEELAERFDVDFVIDVGDINNAGTSVEGEYAAGAVKGKRRIFFVSGNHDSPAVVSALRKVPNVTILDSRLVTVAGISIYGVADPASKGETLTPEEVAIRTRAAVKELASRGETPTILAIHNPQYRELSAPFVKIVVAGHSHRMQLEKKGGSVYLNPGSVGGFMPVKLRLPTRYTAMILYFVGDTLVAVNQAEVWDGMWRYTGVDMRRGPSL